MGWGEPYSTNVEITAGMANAVRELDMAVKLYLLNPTTTTREAMSRAHDALEEAWADERGNRGHIGYGVPVG